MSTHPQGYSRRQVLRLASLAVGAAALPSACQTIAGTPDQNSSPTPKLAMEPRSTASTSGSSRVVLIRTEDRVTGTRQALELLQPEGMTGQTIFIKPNYNTADPAPASTDTELLKALIEEFQAARAGQITIGDRSGMAETRTAMTQKGVFELSDRYGVKTVVLDELAAEDWQSFPAAGTHWPQGFAFARPILQAGAIVNTCCLKTHRFGGHVTLSLKNSVGMVAKYVPGQSHNYMNDLHTSPQQRLMIAEINRVYQPALVLLDGVEAFVNGGPEAGKTVKAGVILAGTDRVAIDVVGTAILRSLGTTSAVSAGSIWQQDQIRRAVELGLGASHPDQIEIVTADAAGRAMADQLLPLLQV